MAFRPPLFFLAFFIGFFWEKLFLKNKERRERKIMTEHVISADASSDDALGEALHDATGTAHLLAPGQARPYLALVQPLIESLGFQLLRIRMTGDDGKMILQIMAENDAFGLTI